MKIRTIIGIFLLLIAISNYSCKSSKQPLEGVALEKKMAKDKKKSARESKKAKKKARKYYWSIQSKKAKKSLKKNYKFQKRKARKMRKGPYNN